MYVVEQDGHSVARSLCQTNISWYNRLKYLSPKKATEVGYNLPG
jgi:hypothetical protein